MLRNFSIGRPSSNLLVLQGAQAAKLVTTLALRSMLAVLYAGVGFPTQSHCPDADYYSFGDGYAAAFRFAPSGEPDQLVKEWPQTDTADDKPYINQLHFGVNIGGTTGSPVFAVMSENLNKVYRFAPCEAEPFGEQPQIDFEKLTGGMKQPVWGHFDKETRLLYVAMFDGKVHSGLAVLKLASPAAADWSFHSSIPCKQCAHVHSVWSFAAAEILIADVGVPWEGKQGKGVFRLTSDGFQNVSDPFNARVLAADPDGSRLYVVTQENMKVSSRTRVYQLQRDNDKLITLGSAQLPSHAAGKEGGAVVESLGESGKVLVTDRSGNGGAGYVVEFGEKGEGHVKLGAALSANNPRFSVLKWRADAQMPYTILTADDGDDRPDDRPVWKTDFTTAADAKSTPAASARGLKPASHIVQVR